MSFGGSVAHRYRVPPPPRIVPEVLHAPAQLALFFLPCQRVSVVQLSCLRWQASHAVWSAPQPLSVRVVQLSSLQKVIEMQSTRGPRNALHEAALCGRPQQVKDLLGGPIDINGGTLLDGSTPLMLAAQEGRSEIVRILLESGANVKMSAEQGFTCLHIAAEQGHFQVVVDLVNFGAEVDARNHNGDRALHLGDLIKS